MLAWIGAVLVEKAAIPEIASYHIVNKSRIYSIIGVDFLQLYRSQISLSRFKEKFL